MPDRFSHAIPALFACLTLAAALRLWGIDYGIPHTVARPDEETLVQTAFNLVGKRELDPQFFEYPSLGIYTTALALEGYRLTGTLRGTYDAPSDFLLDAVVRRPGLAYRIARRLSVGLALLSVVATFALGWESSRRAGAALLAAFLLAISFLHVAFSRFATVDVAMVLFVTSALVFCLRAARTNAIADYLLAGILTGLAASAKYNAGLVGLALIPAAFRRRGVDRTSSPLASGGKLALAGLASLLAFAATSPYALVHWDAVQAGLTKHSYFYTHGPDRLGLWVHLSTTFPVGLGWPLYAAGLAGLVAAVKRRRAEDAVLLLFFFSFLALIGGVRVVYPRYALPLLPVLIVFASELLVTHLRRRWVLVGAVAVCALPNLMSSIRFDRLAAKRDTRLLAADWVAENVPRRSTILLCQGYGAPEINSDRRRPPAFEPRSVVCRPEVLRETEARYLITHEHPVLTRYSSLDPEMRDLLEGTAVELARFDPFRKESAGTPLFYYSDAFYLPLAGFQGVERGGPIVTLWELGPGS